MTLPDLGAWLASHRAPDAKLTLQKTSVQASHDELQRLRQSNDRMRKQNAKLRKRIARLKAGEPDADADADAITDAGATPDGDTATSSPDRSGD